MEGSRASAGPRADIPPDFRRSLAPDGDAVPKAFRSGTHRSAGPDTLLSRLMPRLGDFGITRVARITGFDRTGLEVFAVARPASRGLSVANGKGASREAARLSGVMEAVERWHAERPLLPLRFGTAEDLAVFGAPVTVDGLPRATSGATGARTWAPALDIVGGGAALVPFDLVHTCWLDAVTVSARPFHPSTDGLASGTHPVEAVLHGLCELIEADAIALFESLPAEARAARRIDLSGICDPGIAALVADLAVRGFALALWEVTSDVGIATFACALMDTRHPRTPPGFGSGCHPDRAVAAFRAISEAAQTRVIAITGTRDDLGSDLFAGQIGVRFRWALAGGSDGARPFAAAPDTATDCLRADLLGVLGGLALAGCGPALAIDLSREAGLAVARVVVPGLEAGGGALPGPRAARAAEIYR